MIQRRPISQGGSEPCLLGKLPAMHLLWAWTTALWPEAGILRPYPLDTGVGNSLLPPLSCELEEIGSGEFTSLRGVPWIFLTFSSWHPRQRAPPHLLCLWAGPNWDLSPFGMP